MTILDQHRCGGTTETTDDNAPKTIISTELTKFSLCFSNPLNSPMETDAAIGFPEGTFSYEISKNEQGQFLLTKNKQTYVLTPNVMSFLAVQIKLLKIAEQNGKESKTQGLPKNLPFYRFSAAYASGETIHTSATPGCASWCFVLATFLDSYIAKATPAPAAAPPQGLSWNCSCGQKNLRTKFCGECGTMSPINLDD